MEFNDKAMIALTVPDPELYAMPVQTDSTIPADDLHITLAYLGDAADISDEEKSAILDACQTLADTSVAPESLFPASTGVFPPEPGVEDAEVPTYASPSNPELFDTLRQDLMVHLSARGVAERVADKHPVFTPHVTLAYSPLGERPDVSHLPTPLPTRFTTLRVSFGPEDHLFELSTPVEGTPLPLTASVRAQLARLSARTETSEDYLTALYMRQRQVTATPSQTRAQAALNNVHALVDPHHRSKPFQRVETLARRVNLEADPARKAFIANRALVLAAKHTNATPTEARELGALTASLRTLIADGNSSVARSLRARKQLRDRFGRWIEQGGGVRFKVRVPGAPGGGTWYHGVVEGFDIPNGRVNVKLDDGRIVGIPNKKIEQPKAILGLRTKVKDAAKTFLPKSANRSNPELEQPLRQADPETDKLDMAAMDGLDNIYELSKGVATKDPTGGNVVRLAIDASNSDAYKVAKENGSTDFDFTGVVAPFKGEAIAFDVADVDAVRAAYDNRVAMLNKPAEGASEEETKKALQKAQSGAIGYLAGLYNDKHDEDAVALRKAPSVGTDQELEEVAPEQASPSTDMPDAMEMVDAVDDAYNRLFDLVPDDHPLSSARDQIGTAIQGANERFVNNEDDQATYLKNLDSIKEFANDQEPAFKSPSAVKNPVEEAFGAFSEDIDDIHAAADGVDDIDAVRSALSDISSLAEDIDEEPQEYPDALTTDLNSAIYQIEKGIKSGKYLNNTDGLAEDVDSLLGEMSDMGLESTPAFESLQAAREPFGDVPEAPPAPESVPDTTPETPEGATPDFTPLTADDITKLAPLEPMAYDDGAGIAAPGVDIPLPDGTHAYLTKTAYDANENYGDAGVFRVTVRPGPGTVPIDAQTFKYDESPYGSQNGAMNQNAAKKAVADWINAKAEGAAPKTGENADLDAEADYTDAPDNADDAEMNAFAKFQDIHGAMYDLMSNQDGFISSSNPDTDTQILAMSDALDTFEAGYMAADDEERKSLVDDVYSAATNVAEAFGQDQAYDSGKIQSLVDAATDLKATYGTQDDDAPAPEIGNATVGENAPGFSDFNDLYGKFESLLGEYDEETLPAEVHERAATAGNTVANVGNDLQQGKIDAEEAVDLLANAVTDINDMLSDDDDLAESEFGMDLDSLMGQVSNLQGKLSTDGFNPDEDAEELPNIPEAPAPVVPDKSTWDGLDSNEKAAIDDEANMLLSWLNTKSEQLQGEPDFEDGQGAGFEKPYQAIKDFTTLQDDLEEASLAYSDGELTHQEFADKLADASTKWMESDGFAELASIGDEDGTMAEEFDTDQNISALIEKIPGVIDRGAIPSDVPADDPWADVEPGRTTPWSPGQTPVDEIDVPFDDGGELAEWEKELLGMLNESLPVLEENAPEAVAPVQKLLNDVDDYMKSDEPKSELVELLLNGGNIYLDEMDSIPAPNDDAAAAVEGAKAPVEEFVEKLEAVDLPDETDPQVEMSKLQGIIDSLNAQDGFIQKILAGSLQEKLDNGEEISASDLEQVQAFLGNIAESENTTPEEKADYKLAQDALDVETAVPAEAPEVPEVPESPAEALPEAPEAPATPAETPATLEESIAAWKKSLSDYLASPAFTGSDPSAAMVHGSVHNPLNDKQAQNIQNLVDSYGPGGLSANDADKLQKALNAHKKAEISDDELIQAISSIADNYAFYSKVAGRLRGAQSGVQVNKPALVGVLRPKEEYYGDPDDLDDTDFFMASPEVVQGTLNKILEQSLAGADLEALLKTAAVGTDDAAVSGHIDNAKMFVSVALDALQTGNAEFMIANMRDALNEFDSAIALRAKTHKNDKVIRRLRARRRSLDETLAAFEGRWPDPVVGGTKQEKHGGFIINNSHSMEDKEGNLVYPGDIIERTYGSAKGQLALTVATENVNGVPRALVQLDDHPDVYHNGLGNKSFVLSAVGPNNPLYSDPSYTGPKVDATPGKFGNLADIQKTYADNQVKKGKGAAAPTPTDEPTPVEAPAPANSFDEKAAAYQAEIYDTATPAGLEQIADRVQADGLDGLGVKQYNLVMKALSDKYTLLSGGSSIADYLDAKNKPQAAEEVSGHLVGDEVSFPAPDGYGVISGKIINFDSVGTQYEAATVETPEGDLHLVPINDINAPGAAPESDLAEKPAGPDIKDQDDPEQFMKDLPAGSEVKTPSYVAGLDFMTWTKGDDGYWKGEYDTTSHQGLLEEPWVVLTKEAEAPFDPNDPESDGFDDGQDLEPDFYDEDDEIVDEPFIFDPTTMVGEIMGIPTLFELDEYADKLENAFNGGEITESQYNAAMGIVNYRRDQLQNPPEPPSGPGGGEPTPDAPSTPPAPSGASVFQPLPADQKGQDGDMWVTVNGQHKWGRYGAAGVAVTHTDADGKKYVLLGKRGDRDEWYLPGGALDEGESPIQGATREFIEEATEGADIAEMLTLVSESEYDAGEIDNTDGEHWKYTTLIADLPDMVDVTVPPGSNPYELGEYKWVDADELDLLDEQGSLHAAMSNGRFAKLLGFKEGEAEPLTDATLAPDNLADAKYDMTGWKKLGGAGGSNGALKFQDANGNTFYAKTAQTEAHAHNEVLASFLYERMGITASKARIGTLNGKTYIVSPEVKGDQNGFQKLQSNPQFLAALQDGFAVDAWLGNYDVIGNSSWNVIADENGMPVRIDAGGSLMYRGTGSIKSWWGNTVNELKDMRFGSNKSGSYGNAKNVFGKMSDEQVAESAKKLLAITPTEIQEIVSSTGFATDVQKGLVDTLIKRRHNILKTFNIPDQPEMLKADDAKAIQNSMPVGVPTFNVGQKIKFKGENGATGVVKTVYPDGTIKIKQDNSTDGFATMASINDIEPADIPDAVAEGGKVFLYSLGGKNFAVGDTIHYLDGPSQEWVSGTLDDSAPEIGFGGEKFVKFTSDGGVTWGVNVKDVVSDEAFKATAPVEVYDAPPTTIDAAPDVWAELGDGFATPPAGSTLLKKQVSPYYGIKALVQHPDGQLTIYSNYGAAAGKGEKAFMQNPDSYKSEKGWVDIHTQIPAAAETPAPETPEATEPIFGDAYANVPEGAEILYKHSDGELNPYLVAYPNGTHAVFYNDGDTMPFHADMMDPADLGWEEYTGPQKGVEGTTPAAAGFSLPSGYDVPPAGSIVMYQNNSTAAYVVEEPDGSVWTYYADGGGKLKYADIIKESLLQSMDSNTETFDKVDQIVGESAAKSTVADVTPSGVVDLGVGYATPPAGAKPLYKEVNGQFKSILVEHENGDIHIYWNDGTSGYYSEEMPDSVINNTNPGSGNNWVAMTEQSVAGTPDAPETTNADPNAPLSSEGKPLSVGDSVKIIKYAKKGRPTTGKVMKVTPDGAVRIKLLNEDGSVYLDDKGKPVYSIAAAGNVRHNIVSTVAAKDLSMDGLPPGLIFTNPDTENPLYGTDKPEPPATPAAQAGNAVSDEWIEKADALYKQRKLNKYPNDPNPKGAKESSYWNTYYANVLQGSETDLKWLLDNDYIDQALFDEAKANQAEYLAKQADLMADYQKQYDAWSAQFAEWKKAQGGASVVPLAHNDPSVQSWSHSEAWENMNDQFGDQKISGPASSGAGSQKSGGWQEHIRSIAQTVGLKKEDIAAQPNVSPSAMTTWEKLSGLGGLSTNEGVKKPFRAIMTRRFWQFSDPSGKPFTQGGDLSSMKGTIQKDFGAMEFTPGSVDDGGAYGYAGSDYKIVVDLVVPAGIKGVWTGSGQWGFGGKTSEMGFIAESGLAMYIWDVEHAPFSLKSTGGGNRTFSAKVKASLIPTELYPYMEYFQGNPDSHDVVLPEQAQKIIDQYKNPLGLTEGQTSTNPFENQNDGTVGDNQ